MGGRGGGVLWGICFISYIREFRGFSVDLVCVYCVLVGLFYIVCKDV